LEQRRRATGGALITVVAAREPEWLAHVACRDGFVHQVSHATIELGNVLVEAWNVDLGADG
jgi:hypothetical protein